MKTSLTLLPLLTLVSLSTFANTAQLPPPLPVPIPAMSGLPGAVPATPDVVLKVSRGETLFEVVRLVLNDILKVNFYISPELVNSQDTVSVNFNGLPKDLALSTLETILTSRGFELKKGKVYTIVKLENSANLKKVDEATQLFTYHVKNPKSFYQMSSQLPVIFPSVCFSFGTCAEDKQPITTAQKLNKEELPPSFFSVIAPISQVKQVKSMLEKIDIPLPKIYLKAALYEVSSNVSEGNGVSLAVSLLNDKLKIKLGDDLGIKQSISFSTPSISAVFGTLDGDSRFKAITAPELSLVNGSSATITSGSQYPIPTTTKTDKDQTQTYDFKDIGTSVNITPELFPETALLNVGFEISDVAKYASSTSVPILNTSKFSGQTTVKYGEVFIFGGITISKEIESSTSFFGFKTSKTLDNTKRQLVLVGYVEKES